MIAPKPAIDAAADVIQPEMARVLAAKTESERLRIAWGMWRSARRMIERIVVAERPELSAVEVQTIVARRMS
ncbi:MAG: hypothetical protein ACK5EN_21335, partial [Planctomyces sp.]